MHYQILDWDTNFFDVTVARIIEPVLDEREISDLLFELKAEGVALAYCPLSRELEKEIV